MLETKCQENARAIAQQMKKSGGGSGSDVTVTQVLASGTKIATIKVDDDSTDLYCETVPATYDADDIAYDNTTSGLTATNVQAAIDEVAQGGGGGGVGAWTLAGSVTGSTPVSIPAGAKEIYVIGDVAANPILRFPMLLIADILTDNDEYRTGYYAGPSSNAALVVKYSAGTVLISAANNNSSDVTATSTMKVYTR